MSRGFVGGKSNGAVVGTTMFQLPRSAAVAALSLGKVEPWLNYWKIRRERDG